jgi:hypothetical protein
MKSESPNVRSLVKALVPLIKKCPSMTANDIRSAMYGLQGMHSSSKEGTLNVTPQWCLFRGLLLCIALPTRTFITCVIVYFFLFDFLKFFLLSFLPNDSTCSVPSPSFQ